MADAEAAAGADGGNNLYSVALLIDELKHEDVNLRLNSMRKARPSRRFPSRLFPRRSEPCSFFLFYRPCARTAALS